jgi:large subunit ribosomal protein L19
MHPIIAEIEKRQLKADVPSFSSGDKIRVHLKIKEGDKERIQVFEGIVLRRRRGATSASFTVRKVSYGIGVERIFPLHSPMIDKIEVVTIGDVRQSRIYYLRDLRGKKARIKEKRDE